MSESQSRELTLTAVAELAGVRPSAVGNWRTRWSDFPAPLANGLYPETEVLRWLRGHDKKVQARGDISLAHRLWKSADALRGLIGVEDMPTLLLQLLVLRAASDGRIERLKPLKDAWRRLRDSRGGELDFELTLASQSVGSDSELRDALEPTAGARQVRGGGIAPVIDLLSSPGGETDWGLVATDLLLEFAERFGLRGTEYSTPRSVAHLVARLLEPLGGTIYDPACGSGVMLARVWDSLEVRDATKLYGQEINAQTWRLAVMHLVLHDADFELALGDTLTDDRFWSLKADRIAAQPPFGQRVLLDAYDQRWIWGQPGQSADVAWLQHVAFHLAPGGIAVAISGAGMLSRGGTDARVRAGIIEADLVDSIIQLPAAVLPGVSVAPALIVLSRDRGTRSGTTLFVDASNVGKNDRRAGHRISSDDVDRIAGVVLDWRTGHRIEQPGFAATVTSDDLLAQDGVLSVARYVSYEAETDPAALAREFEQMSRNLRTSLDSLTAAVDELGAELGKIEVAE